MKFTGFSENKECMFLFKTQSVCIVIYCLFLKALENRNGKLLSFFWSSHLRCSLILKNKFRKIHSKTPVPEQNSEQNNCVRVSFLINLHAFVLQLKTQVFSYEFSEIFRNTFFQITSGQLLLNFTNENKASESEISNRLFYFSWSFICILYGTVTNSRRPANKFIKPC